VSIPVPMDEQAELSVLGSMLMSPAACSTAVQRLSPSDFYRSSHGRVFAAIRDAHEQLRDSEIVDTVLVRSLLADSADRVVLNTAPSVVPAVANASRYVDVVLDLAHRRRLAQVADQTAHAARNGGVSEKQRRSLSDMLDATPSHARPPFAVYSAEQLRDLPPAEMLIDGLLVRGGFNVKYGATDALKTFTAIDETLTIASASGDWHGRRTRHGVVVYCAGEGGGGLWKRVEAWCMSTGRPLPEDALFIV
jgi:hypothetical protein